MLSHKFDLRSIVGMALCALLSLVAFLTFLILMAYNDRFMVILGLTASLVCPAIWLTILLLDDGDGGGGLVQFFQNLGLTSQAVGQEITLPKERELVAGSASLAP